MELKELGLKLLRAESVDEVEQIINDDRLLADSANWGNLDNRQTNSNVVTNQASVGGKAATELITNMVDAVLMKRCLEKGIDPKGSDAPPTMYRAVDSFIKPLNGGKILHAESSWLRDFSGKNLVVGITGARTGKRPNYTFADNGEGQHPQDFPKTFLSLSARNKSEIPFVQGKYNMGSSGVLNFCRYKLIVSRRHDKTGKWGWTLTMLNFGGGSPVAIYFMPPEGIPTLGDKKTLYPFWKDGKRFDDFSLDSGTVVKLYEFHAGRGFSGFRGAREAFNENLVETILPFRILDFRWKPDPTRSYPRPLGIDARGFYGMEFLLCREHAESTDESGEDDAPVAADKKMMIGKIDDNRLGQIVIYAIPLKREIPGWLKSSHSRIFHCVNGQVQYKRMRGFFTECKLPALKDRAIIIVDASGLHSEAQWKIWKGDRENVQQTQEGDEYLVMVKEKIAKSPELRELNFRFAQEEIENIAEDGSRKLLPELIKADSTFALLLDGKVPDISIGPVAPQPPTSSFVGKVNPTFVKLRYPNRTEIEIPINRSRPVPCYTDAENDYLIRDDNRGGLFLENPRLWNLLSFDTILKDGNFTVFIRPDSRQVGIGDEFSFRVGLKDDGMAQAVFTEQEIRLKITTEQHRDPPSPPAPTPPTGARGLPRCVLLTKDGRDVMGDRKTKPWTEAHDQFPDFSEKDGGYVKDLGDNGTIHYVNYDNTFFQNQLRGRKQESERTEAKHKYVLGMQIFLLGFEGALKSIDEEARGEIEDQFRRAAAHGAASVCLTLCDNLPRIFANQSIGDSDSSE